MVAGTQSWPPLGRSVCGVRMAAEHSPPAPSAAFVGRSDSMVGAGAGATPPAILVVQYCSTKPRAPPAPPGPALYLIFMRSPRTVTTLSGSAPFVMLRT